MRKVSTSLLHNIVTKCHPPFRPWSELVVTAHPFEKNAGVFNRLFTTSHHRGVQPCLPFCCSSESKCAHGKESKE